MLERIVEMKPEVYFLRYAFPCSHVICKVRKEINDGEWKRMKEAAERGEAMERKYLEKVFHRAFERIDKIAAELGKDRWNEEVIKEYFVRRHTAVVNATEHPEAFKDQCRVHIAMIKEIDDGKLLVEYEWGGEKKTRKVFGTYVPDAKPGDKVTIHYAYAVEKI